MRQWSGFVTDTLTEVGNGNNQYEQDHAKQEAESAHRTITTDSYRAALQFATANNKKGWGEAKVLEELNKAHDYMLGQPDTLQTYSKATPEWRAQRDALRQRIVQQELSQPGAVRAKGRPSAYVILGPPGSGKSTLSRTLTKTHVEIDADRVKEHLPEYNRGLGANTTHEESSLVKNDILRRAIHGRMNMVLPAVGRTYESTKAQIDSLGRAGYDVHLRLVNVTPDVAVGRVMQRFIDDGGDKTHVGRFVDPTYVHKSVDGKPEQTYVRLLKETKLASSEAYNNMSSTAKRYHPEKGETLR